MKNFKTAAVLMLFSAVLFSACKTEKDALVTISTNYGDMKVVLFDETPKHKENFLKLAKNGDYNQTYFHRVMDDFMIQGGDINRVPGKQGSIDYTIPFEFSPNLVHTKGMLAAARIGENQGNPERNSSGCQFYIVEGTKYELDRLKQGMEQGNKKNLSVLAGLLLRDPAYSEYVQRAQLLQSEGNMQGLDDLLEELRPLVAEKYGAVPVVSYTTEQMDAYVEVGGTPFLDGSYTVFGKVIDGLPIVDSVAQAPLGRGTMTADTIFMTITVEEMPKKKITKLYGYEYPQSN